MRLQERLPNYITVGKKKVRVDLDFRNVLNMIEILGEKDLMPLLIAFIRPFATIAIKTIITTIPATVQV